MVQEGDPAWWPASEASGQHAQEQEHQCRAETFSQWLGDIKATWSVRMATTLSAFTDPPDSCSGWVIQQAAEPRVSLPRRQKDC
jgi:hypothetical protein